MATSQDNAGQARNPKEADSARPHLSARSSDFLDPGVAPTLGVDEIALENGARAICGSRLSCVQVAAPAHCRLVRTLGGFGCVHDIAQRVGSRIRFLDRVDSLG